MQRYTVYFIWKLLYMFRVVPPPIIRSADNYIQHLVFVTPLLLPATSCVTLHLVGYIRIMQYVQFFNCLRKFK
jgi:hypothetical protein